MSLNRSFGSGGAACLSSAGTSEPVVVEASAVKHVSGLTESVSLSEIVSALSFALDLVEDAKPGHAVRTCMLGMRIGHSLGLAERELADLYYALLMKDVGCSTNSRVICQMVGGDDRVIKREAKLNDWTRASFSAVRMMWRNPRPGASMRERLGRIVNMGINQDACNAQVIGMRCERGSQIVHKMGLSREVAEGVRALDEHWDGSGHPDRLVGHNIPVLARILNIAQHLDLFATEQGRNAAMDVVAERSGRWFDPALVKIVNVLDRDGTLWADYGTGNERMRVHGMEPGYALRADDQQINHIAEAFADVVDAKSSFTFRHSIGVTEASSRIAEELGLAADRKQVVYRASLLHDLGKLRVSNTILDKTSKLDGPEWSIVQEHPGLTKDILNRIGAFREIAEIAGNHHEKLDGSGYPFKLRAGSLSQESRILTVADIYGALSEDRPYRAGLDLDTIRGIMSKEVPHKLDQECFEALMASLAREPKAKLAA